MIVSWNWLSDYVKMDMTHDELVERLTMSGLNHEGTEPMGADRALDLEVTSNRPDCLGHIGVAREIAVLFGHSLQIPPACVTGRQPSLNSQFDVEIQCPQLCHRFTARLVRGVKIGPSPDWLAQRLQAIGIASINNVVDITNYVMFECGQPLHAFDYAKLRGGRIVVRQPVPEEQLLAIDHRQYRLPAGTCVIADAQKGVGIGGIMGGAESEVSAQTTDVLIECAHFNPMKIRQALRRLSQQKPDLRSPASYRFERSVDSHQIDWASRRCCQLIIELAGGELADGVIDVGLPPVAAEAVTLRLFQLERLLGIEIPIADVLRILQALGMQVLQQDSQQLTVQPPSWRRDITREADLVEEVGRVFGYQHIPDNLPVPIVATRRLEWDRIVDRMRRVLTAAGVDEAVTPSLVPRSWSESFSPWCDAEALHTRKPMVGILDKAAQHAGPADQLRRSLIPSLLEVCRLNQFKSNQQIELFELAKVYLPQPGDLPKEPWKIGIASQRGFYAVKGIVEAMVRATGSRKPLQVQPSRWPLLDGQQQCRLESNGETVAHLGVVSEAGQRLFELRHGVTVGEVDLALLVSHAVVVATHRELSQFPAISRDFNFVVDQHVHWEQLRSAVVQAGGPWLRSVDYRETFRNPEKDGADKKRLLLSVVLRSDEQTLTGEMADQVCQQIIERCHRELNAVQVS